MDLSPSVKHISRRNFSILISGNPILLGDERNSKTDLKEVVESLLLPVCSVMKAALRLSLQKKVPPTL